MIKVCFLLVECYLALQQPDNAMYALNHMERHLLEKNSCPSLQHSPTNPSGGGKSSKASASPEKDPAGKGDGCGLKLAGKSLGNLIGENSHFHFFLFFLLCCFSLSSAVNL